MAEDISKFSIKNNRLYVQGVDIQYISFSDINYHSKEMYNSLVKLNNENEKLHSKSMLLDHILHNVDNEKLSDEDFRSFVQSFLGR